MEDKLILLAQVVILIFTAILAYRRMPFQNSTDAAGAIEKFQNVTVSLQAKVMENEKQIEHLTNLLEDARLTLTIGIQIGKKPEILDYSWTTRGQVPPFTAEKVA